MGMYATIHIDNRVELPHFPRSIDRDDMKWQSKRGLDVYGGPYRITSEGRLERKQTSRRDKTEDEKQEEAERWGFSSWEEYVSSYENMDDGRVFPSEINYDRDSDEHTPPTFSPSETTVDEVWWADHNMHGTFEFHRSIKAEPVEYEKTVNAQGEEVQRPSEYELDVYLQYEARFTRGDLDQIVFMGERSGEDSVEETASKLREWDREHL